MRWLIWTKFIRLMLPIFIHSVGGRRLRGCGCVVGWLRPGFVVSRSMMVSRYSFSLVLASISLARRHEHNPLSISATQSHGLSAYCPSVDFSQFCSVISYSRSQDCSGVG